MTTIYSSIAVRNLELSLHLGWKDEELLKLQSIFVDIGLRFSEPPKATQTDNLEDTFCYHALINQIVLKTTKRKFRLVEYLGKEIYAVVKNKVSADVCIRILKKPAISQLKGDIVFCYGDFAWQW